MILGLLLSTGAAEAQEKEKATGVLVTPETYIRAETDRQFAEIAKMADGVNRFYHFRSPTPLDKQNIVRMNRDTLYSMGIVDTSKGATITVPELPEGRYASVFLVDNDNYTPVVFYTAGTHELPKDTQYFGVGIRIKVFNPNDLNEIALVNKLQDQFIIKAGSAQPLPAFKWDRDSLKALTVEYEKDSKAYSSWKGMAGPRGKVNEKTRHIMAAAAWGAFPEWDATYLNYIGGDDLKTGWKATYKVPENKGFWSITVYGNDGFMKSENCIVNSSNVKLNSDGTFTVYYGSKELCGDVPNRLDVTEGWNFLMRVYRPGQSVLDGSYKLPEVVPVKPATPAEVRAIAKEAYVYGYPMVDNLRIQYSYFVDRTSPEFKFPYNTLFNIPRVYTPEDKAIQTPNSDTPYSWIGLDLRSEPIVFTVPRIEKERYWSLQLIDLYTHNFEYLGTRTTGNDGGSYLIAGPNWQGETPKGITKVIRCETDIASAQFRTQLYNPDDLDNVKKIQSQYIVKPLSGFLGQPAPNAAPAIVFPKPLSLVEQKSSLEFFNHLNFGLQFCSPEPSEKELRGRFARIGVGPGAVIDFGKFTPDIKKAYEAGIADAWEEFDTHKKRIDRGELTSGDVFGTRTFLKNNYAYRMTAAVLGIYGNSKQEAMYPTYYVDAEGKKLSGANHYELRFAPGQLPPVDAFWSLTMYDQPNSLLVANPLNRYLINSTMMKQFKQDTDGGLTVLVQNESPGKDRESNWLPAPKGDFSLIMRLYRPKAEALEGKWTAPPLKLVK